MSAEAATVVPMRGSLLGKPLSQRERQILVLMCEGKKLNQIEALLHLARGTVGMYRTRMAQKTGCKTSAQLGVWAARHWILDR